MAHRLGDLADPLPTGIVNVVGFLARSVVDDLLLCGLQLIFEIPLHRRQVRHLGHIAVRVVAVGPFHRADCCAGETIVRRDWVGLVILVRPSPIPVVRRMNQGLDVADWIILVRFAVGAHGLYIIWVRQRLVHPRRVLPDGLGSAHLPDVFAAGRIRQPINCVVNVVGVGFDSVVFEIDDILDVRVILDVRDVADRVVEILQILKQDVVAFTSRD